MDSELTWDKAIDSVITTPQSQWSPYQIAVANLNPDLKAKNKKYQSAFDALSVLENERVNLWQAWQIMMNAYKEAIDRTEEAAERQMNANAAAAAIQAWWIISWSAWLATNPAAAAQQRIAAQNQASVQNAQVRSNADQNIANIYNNVAQAPATLASMASNNAQIDANNLQAEANANLANAQANYYNKQASSVWTSWWSSRSSSSSSSSSDSTEDDEATAALKKIAAANWLEFDPENWIKWWSYIDQGNGKWFILKVWDKTYNDNPELNDALLNYFNRNNK